MKQQAGEPKRSTASRLAGFAKFKINSVDQLTETHLKEVIHEEFRNHTVIAIAHRLETIADFDRDVSFFWKQWRVPLPGECILRSQQLFIDGIAYEELVNERFLVPEFQEPKLVTGTSEASPRTEAIVHDLVTRKMEAYSTGAIEYERCVVDQHLRR